MQNFKFVEISTHQPKHFPLSLSLSLSRHFVRVKDDNFLFCIPNDCRRPDADGHTDARERARAAAGLMRPVLGRGRTGGRADGDGWSAICVRG